MVEEKLTKLLNSTKSIFTRWTIELCKQQRLIMKIKRKSIKGTKGTNKPPFFKIDALKILGEPSTELVERLVRLEKMMDANESSKNDTKYRLNDIEAGMKSFDARLVQKCYK